MDEQKVWEGTPSQAVNFGLYVVCGLLFWLAIPLFIALGQWLAVRSTRYVLTTERLRITTGLFTRRTEEIELYRVKDTAYEEPFALRLFGAGNIEVTASDSTTPFVRLEGVRDGEVVREEIRHYVEVSRRRMGTRAVEFSSPTGRGW